MKKYIINGRFLVRKITGVERYAREIINELDKLVEPNQIIIAVPTMEVDFPQYANIKVVKVGKKKEKSGVSEALWEQIEYPRFVKKENGIAVNLCNKFPILYNKGIVAIHDVSYKVNKNFFDDSLRGRMAILLHEVTYWCAAHSSMKIVTVSQFSKSEIMKYYGIPPQRITVIYNAWQHMKRIENASDTFQRYPELVKGSYYFSMSTLAANKNFKWILYAAKNNPDKQFAIAGGGKLKGAAEAEGFANLPNIHFLGYVSDEDAKTLMENCRAFLFPTLYEGFGIPPLEAIACGAPRIIVSDTPCMHEIYGNYATYIDPLDYENIQLPSGKTELCVENLLDKYSWTVSAEKLWKEILL